MVRFHEITLEMVRPGPSHNQLLSPLTPYLALCGDGSPTTFHVRVEHHKLLSQLADLRYSRIENRRELEVTQGARVAALLEVGREIEDVLAQIPALLAEISRTRGTIEGARFGAAHDAGRCAVPTTQFVHLRLVLGGSELALLPFEMALAPPAMPGEGQELFLQGNLPIVVTRETRHGAALHARWDLADEPRVLLICGEPSVLPLNQHIGALMQALEPWVKPDGSKRRPTGEAPLDEKLRWYKRHLRVLPSASLAAIHAACAQECFTHVHVLAHGFAMDVAGEKRYGVALSKADEPLTAELVGGQALAKALQPERRDGSGRTRPLVVTLMTCDAGNGGSVLIPGSSIAHDLHIEGIPWVFASQLPLRTDGSVRLTRDLYPLLLRGDDPRQVLYEVRRKLYLNGRQDHDWASMVAYAAVPPGFEEHVAEFRAQQAKRVINTGLDLAATASEGSEERQIQLDRVKTALDVWCAQLPTGPKVRSQRAECFGMYGSTLKRIALLSTAPDPAGLQDALRWYRRAIDEASDETPAKSHWVTTQALSLIAILGQAPESNLLRLTQILATRELDRLPLGTNNVERAWAHGSLAELEMLATYHRRERFNDEADRENAKGRVMQHCVEVVKLAGPMSFPVESTRRQFARYLIHWRRPEWDDIAQAAFEALGGTQAELGKELGRGAEVRAQAKADEAPERPSAEAASDRAGRRVKKPAKRAAKQR